ncbi:MAG: hypothetical protein ABEI52_04790 [Halobacteriaceae archaeon]
MGRTNPTFRDALRVIKDRWGDYRRALRQRYQSQFDQLFDYAREHADAAGLLNHQNPILPILVSIDLEQERRLDEHEDRLDALEDDLAELQTSQAEQSDAEQSSTEASHDGVQN